MTRHSPRGDYLILMNFCLRQKHLESFYVLRNIYHVHLATFVGPVGCVV
ncbi:hypothetical protein SAMN05444362_1308 [Dysgonomonas macrotermitis]|uniref:Uncharacterized protein n=1 Tax=Dysgonomonas macrotermitis TaxID=1346286 RepID=A0A1M5JX22_9BACT|nr:hypothetical protein SAMN05444362_1308 [Dysgonomonas macrotermitis]